MKWTSWLLILSPMEAPLKGDGAVTQVLFSCFCMFFVTGGVENMKGLRPACWDAIWQTVWQRRVISQLYPPIKQAASCVSVPDTRTISGFSIESTDCSTYSVTSILRNRNGSRFWFILWGCPLFATQASYHQAIWKKQVVEHFSLRSLARSPCSKRQGDLHFVMKERWRDLSKRSRSLSQEILRKWGFWRFLMYNHCWSTYILYTPLTYPPQT